MRFSIFMPVFFIKISCLLFLLVSSASYADEKDRMIKRFPAEIGTGSERTQTIQPRKLETQKIPRSQGPLRIQESMPVNTGPAPIQKPEQLMNQKPLDQEQRIQIRRELNELKIQTRRVRENALQLERQIRDKQRILDSTAQPQIKQELQLEIGRMHEQLNQMESQIEGLENQQTIMRKMTTGQQGFADDADHLGDSGYGSGQSNIGGRRESHPCFIATAAYGSPLAEEVQILRQFRDIYLAKTALGRRIITLYETHSPPFANFISHHETARSVTRALLWPLVIAVKHPVLLTLSLMLLLVMLLFHRRKPISRNP
jgi:hypothetical protein